MLVVDIINLIDYCLNLELLKFYDIERVFIVGSVIGQNTMQVDLIIKLIC